jgi:hypothetical protein
MLDSLLIALLSLEAPSVEPVAATAWTCPETVEPLTTQLLKDLPSYANRVIQRSRRLDREAATNLDRATYVQIAGRAEFEPLPLGRDPLPDDPTKQVFFTTLEQQFTGDRATTHQHYHWLFLTPTPQGWYSVYLFTRFSDNTSSEPLPPRETSNGVIGQAIQLWLRDCRAGTVRPAGAVLPRR